MTIFRIHTNDKTEGPRYVIAFHIDDAARAWAIEVIRARGDGNEPPPCGPNEINAELARIQSIDRVADRVIEGRGRP